MRFVRGERDRRRGGTATRRLLAPIGLLVALLAGACAPAPPAARATQSRERHPVVIVHGFQVFCGTETNATWRTWIDESLLRGYRRGDVSVFEYDSCARNEASIAGLAQYVDQLMARTGATKVNIIAHSVGSIISRACIRFGGCAGKVDKLISIAGANHGTIWGWACPIAIWAPTCGDAAPDSERLRTLNADDETWGDTKYVTLVSWCDLTIVPFTGTALAGAINIVSDRCIGHTDWRTDFEYARRTFDWFDGTRRDSPISPPVTPAIPAAAPA